MKVGDKLYCIKDSYGHKGHIAHISGKLYTIQEIRDYPRMSNLPGIDMITSIILNAENGFFGYTLNGGEDFDLYKYFVDIKENRKLKLEKINESR